ncbi:MAG: hypothetical protein ACREL7_04150 [Longimicrobiales bacterium]
MKVVQLSDSAEPGLFGNQVFVQRNSRGRFLTSTIMFDRIAVFDTTGVLRRTIGRRGDGPGEFSRVMTPVPGPGDTLYAHDPVSRRLTVISPEFKVVREITIPYYPALVLPDARRLESATVQSSTWSDR